MKYNLSSIERFRFFGEIKIMTRTVLAVLKKDKHKQDIAEVVIKDKSEVSM